MTLALVYAPMRDFIENHWLMPLSYRNKVVVIRRTSSASGLRRGEWVAFRNDSVQRDHRYLREGLNLSPVVGLPGDHIEFSRGTFFVNGTPHPALANMPQGGELTVPEKRWFLWPELFIIQHGNVNVSEWIMSVAIVDETQFVGKPFKRWFWRRQTF